ncbi:MAG: hypothetical protein SGILL_003417, partial [Bacillariaceae sp.]
MRFLSSLLLFLPSLAVVDAAGSVPEGFIDEIVTSAKGMSGCFAPNPRKNGKPMMILNSKNGRIRVLEDPDESPEDIQILDMRTGVCDNGERGAHSVEPHPNFLENRWLYIFYNEYKEDCLEDPVNGPQNVVMRFTMDAATLELSLDDAVVVWRGAPMDKRLHNGGAMAFGNDGKLWITTGDAGERINAEIRDNVHGSILRINDDGSIPADNPYSQQSGFSNSYRCTDSGGRVPDNAPAGSRCAEVWAHGVRNPFRISMDSNTKDKVRFSISDVGAQHVEALYYGGTDYKLADYGWPKYEGGVCKPGEMQDCTGLSDSSTVTPFH